MSITQQLRSEFERTLPTTPSQIKRLYPVCPSCNEITKVLYYGGAKKTYIYDGKKVHYCRNCEAVVLFNDQKEIEIRIRDPSELEWVENKFPQGFGKPRLFLKCYLCDKKFTSEERMRTHTVFIHGKYVEKCSTGVFEKLQHKAKYAKQRARESIDSYKHRGKRGRNTHGNMNFTKFRCFLRRTKKDLEVSS